MYVRSGDLSKKKRHVNDDQPKVVNKKRYSIDWSECVIIIGQSKLIFQMFKFKKRKYYVNLITHLTSIDIDFRFENLDFSSIWWQLIVITKSHFTVETKILCLPYLLTCNISLFLLINFNHQTAAEHKSCVWRPIVCELKQNYTTVRGLTIAGKALTYTTKVSIYCINM